MARFPRIAVLNKTFALGLVPVFYHKDAVTATQIVNACAAGGATVIEFTNRGDFAYQVFAEVNQRLEAERPDVMLGVGSIVDAPTAALYINSGASFVVGPILNIEVAKLCNRRKIAYSPGCGSATEISAAEELGVEIVKVFPGAEVGGPEFVKNVTGPMPWTRIMPTGGVDATEDSLRRWIKAGAACVGIGAKLITNEIVAQKDWPALTQKVAACLAFIKKARA